MTPEEVREEAKTVIRSGFEEIRDYGLTDVMDILELDDEEDADQVLSEVRKATLTATWEGEA